MAGEEGRPCKEIMLTDRCGFIADVFCEIRFYNKKIKLIFAKIMNLSKIIQWRFK